MAASPLTSGPSRMTGTDRTIGLPLSLVVETLGYAPDSPEGYAAEVLTLDLAARFLLARGQHDEAMAVAVRLGGPVTEAGMKEAFEPDFLRGERVREGGRQAHAKTYGSRQERDAKSAAYAAAFNTLVAKGTARMKAYRAVAKVYGVSERTVRRAVGNSSKNE